jgi:hypothetical protein
MSAFSDDEDSHESTVIQCDSDMASKEKYSDILNNVMKELDKKLRPLLEMQQQLIDQNMKLSNQLEQSIFNNSRLTGGISEVANCTNTTRESSGGSVITKVKKPNKQNKPMKYESKNIVIDTNEEGRITLSGKTYDIKEGLKTEFGAQWKDRCWTLNEESTDVEVIKAHILEADSSLPIVVKCASWTS